MSPAWIGCRLADLPDDARAMALRVRRGGAVAGLALVVVRALRRHGVMPTCIAFVNEAGDPETDGVYIEHNGVLCAPCDRAAVETAALAALTALPDLDEIRLSGAPTRFLAIRPGPGWTSRIVAKRPYFAVDLDRVRAAPDGLPSLLRPNTRQQLRRALRRYSLSGEVVCRAARDRGEALAWLDELAALHQSYWQSRGKPGAFASPRFVAFHRRLIAEAFDEGAIALLRCSAGAAAFGYLYNFVADGRVSAYQSGFAYGDDTKAKPGLVCHALAAADAAARGAQVYDLLAGDSQFKRSLAEAAGELAWIEWRRDRLAVRIEDALRGVMRRLTGGGNPGAASIE